MSGKYLKARQLAKEMEEKAKKTAEKKKEANKKKEEAEEYLEIVNSLNIDMGLGDLEEKLEEGKEKLKNKNFEKSHDIFEEIIEEINSKSVEKHDDILAPIEELMQKADEVIELESLQEKIEKSKNLLQDGKFEDAFEKAFEIEDESNNLINEKLNKELEKLKSIAELITDADDEKERAQELISKADYSLEAEDFSRTCSLLKEAKETFGQGVKKGLIERVETLKERKNLLEEKGVDVQKSEELLENARSKTSEEEYIEALNLIKKIGKEINPLYGEEILRDKFNKLTYELKEAKKIDAIVDPVKKIQKEAENFLEKNQVEKAESRLKDAFKELEEAKFDKVLNTIAESREDFIKAKEMGADIEKPMELLKKARNSLKDDNYKEALDWAREGREEVQELTKKLEKTKEEIIEKQEKLNGLRETLGDDFSELTNLLDDAEKKLEEKKTGEAISSLEKLDKKIKNEVHNKVSNLIEEFEILIQTADKLEIDIREFSKQKEECKTKFDSSQYVKSADIGQKGKNAVKQEIENKLDDEIQKIQNRLDEFKELSNEIEDDIKELINESRENMTEGSYLESVKKFEKAADLFEETKKDITENSIEKNSQLLSKIEKMDKDSIDLDTYKEKIEDAKSSLREEMYSESLNTLKGFLEEFSDKIHKESKKEVQKAEETGAVVEDLENELKKSKEKIEEGDYTDSIQSSIEVMEKAEEKRTIRKEAYEKIYDGSSKVSELKEKGLLEEEESIKEILENAKNEFKQENYSKAIKEAEKALDSLKDIELEEKFSDRIKELKEEFLKAKDMNIVDERIDNFDPEIEKIINMSEEIGMSGARDKLENKREEFNALLGEFLEEKREEIKEFIESSEASGFDIEDYKEQLARINSLKKEGKILDALIFIEEVEEELKDIGGKVEIASKKIEETMILSKKAEVIGTSTGEVDELLEDAKQELEDDNYKESLKKAEAAENKILKAQEDRVGSILENFNQKIEKLKARGVDTSFAEDKIQKAREAKDKGDYIEAIKFSMQSEGELEKINNQKIIAGNIISRAKKMLEEIQDRGIFIDEATETFKECEQAYENGFYPKTVEICLKSTEKLSELIQIHDDLESFLENVNSILDYLRKETEDLSELVKEKEKIEEDFKNGKYWQANEHLEEVEETLNQNGECLKNIVSDIEREVKKEDGKNIEKSIEQLNKAKYLIEMKNPIKALKNIDKAKELSGLKKKKRYETLMEHVRESMKNAKKFGASVENIENKVQEAKDQKNKKDIDGAYNKIKQAYNMVEEILKDYSPKLKLKISETLSIDEWNSTTINIVNEGEALGKNLQIEVRGGELRNFDLGENLKAGEEKEIEVEINPKKENAQMIARVLRIFDDEVFEDEKDLSISRGSTIKKLDKEETCDYCGDKIKKKEKIIQCSCGKNYEISCGKEIEKCPNCGTRLKTEEEKKRKTRKRVSLDI